MKKQLTLLLVAAGLSSTVQSQTWSENFTAPFNPVSAGWSVQNLSASANPTLNWFQGNSSTFPAYNGSATDYFASNWASSLDTTSGVTISDWLITPQITLVNGGVFEFATRTVTNPASFPDRLQVYASLAGNGTNVGTTPTSLGTFSNLIVNINPNLTTTGYPGGWTVYTFTLNGLSSPTPGRIGFRYFVTNGGPAGANSNYIGLDAVKYTFGCLATVPSYTVCSNTSVTLAVNGMDPSSTYTWNTSAQTNSIVVSPASTTTYEVIYSEPGWQCPAKVATVTVGSALSVNVSATSKTICSGQTTTLSAASAATSYSWMNNNATTPTTAVSPTASTVYTVLGWTGTFPPSCAGANTIAITVNQSPTVSITSPASPLCLSGASTQVSFIPNGAAAYLWIIGTQGVQTNTLNINVPANTATQIFTLQLLGATNGCTASATASLAIDVQPTVSIASSANTVCAKGTLTFTATGGNSYQWSGGSTVTTSPMTYTAPATAGTVAINVVGSSSLGCTASAAKTITVATCNTGTTVGLAENTEGASTSVFPNPFSNELRVSGHEGQVIIYNTLGQVVLTQHIDGSAVINTSEFPKGAYVLTAIDANGQTVKTVRVIKN